MEKLYRDRDWLWEHYIVREESMRAVAREAGCSYHPINEWLHKYGISVRSISEGTFLAERNFVIITPDFLEFLRGEILGDGHTGMTGNRSAFYSHGSKYRRYVVWLSGCFDAWGIEQAGRITKRKDKQNGAISYNYKSKSYPELIPIRQRWYSERDGKMKKTVPQDLRLTPIMARQWYLGDGGLTDYKIKRPGIKLSTYDFDQRSVEYLVKELCHLGFRATRRADNTIRIWVRSVPDFLEWIGPCPVSCYDYRWDYLKNA